jgi:hypothetical protein
MEDNENNSELKIGDRVLAEIRARIKTLEDRLSTYRKVGKPNSRDAIELDRLREFLKSLGLTLVICAIACLPFRAVAEEGYSRSQEDTALALLCDAETDPDMPGIIRDTKIKECIEAYREEADDLEGEL